MNEPNKKRKESIKYFGTARAESDHYSGNFLGTIRLNFEYEKETGEHLPDEEFYEPHRKFIEGLEKTLERIRRGELRTDKIVNEKTIKRFLKLAKEINPRKKEDIDRLRKEYEEIRLKYYRNKFNY